MCTPHYHREHATLTFVFIFLRVLPPSIHIDTHKHRHREPNHKNKEEERVTNIACHVRDEANDKGADEGARL